MKNKRIFKDGCAYSDDGADQLAQRQTHKDFFLIVAYFLVNWILHSL